MFADFWFIIYVHITSWYILTIASFKVSLRKKIHLLFYFFYFFWIILRSFNCLVFPTNIFNVLNTKLHNMNIFENIVFMWEVIPTIFRAALEWKIVLSWMNQNLKCKQKIGYSRYLTSSDRRNFDFTFSYKN